MLSKQAYQKSENAANFLITKYKIKKAPIHVLEIAQKEGLKVIEYNFGEDASGVLLVEKGIGTIGYNPKDSLVRQRFTVAHEIAHYTLHRDTNDIFVDSYFLMKFRKNNSYTASEYKHEQEANTFAAALLMPETLIQKEMSSIKYSELEESELISSLAKIFQVSVAAMSYRLTNLNIYF